MNKTLLEVKNLSVSINGQNLLENVSFSIEAGKVLAIIGPNGAGKSVLLKTILGIMPKNSGQIELAPGIKLGYLPQRFHVDYYLPMTVREFLSLKPHPAYSIEGVLELVKMDIHWLPRQLAHLSSGELQKVLLVWSILDKPEIILFDEPTENVDVVSQESIYHLLHELQDKLQIAIILVSHDLQIVYQYSTQVLCINKNMVCYGEPELALTTEKLSQLYGDHAFFRHHHFH